MTRFILMTFVSVILAFGLLDLGAEADVLVLASTDEAVAPGRILVAGESIEVRNGAEVILLFEDGRDERIRGPATFTHSIPSSADRAEQTSFIATISTIVTKLDGERRLGAIRSDDQCPTSTPLGAWSDIAAEWAEGCKLAAVEAVETRLVQLTE